MDIETKAILRLQEAAQMSQQIYEKPLLLTYSGGKDSDLTVDLAIKAGIPFEIAHSLTTVDMPETVYHTRKVSQGWKKKVFRVKSYDQHTKTNLSQCGRSFRRILYHQLALCDIAARC